MPFFRSRSRLFVSSLLCVGAVLGSIARGEDSPQVDFNRDVRPILSNHCFQCHGPDEKQRQAELRLDTKEGAFGKREDNVTITPGKPAESELWRRITSADAEERMPPADAKRDLSAAQIETLRRWIEQGATWQMHWSFVPPHRAALPAVPTNDTIRGAIDVLVQHRLQKERVPPAPAADRATILRRVTLDLTGLPPTPEEVAAFLADYSPDAYERVIDRLLASPRYGERMAAPWLDAARYADTSGYQSDGERHMWRWRDWVIEALNANMPFDQFTIEQLAGDLLPSPTLDQQLATGFNRNHRGNAEGGIIPEEYAVEYVVDRVETTSTVWLGLTVGCARCHSHKYDPLTQHDFYRMYAFFNNVPEKGRAIKIGNSPPFIKTPTRWQQAQLAEHQRRLADAQRKWAALADEVDAAQLAWEQASAVHSAEDWQIAEGLVAHYALNSDSVERASKESGEFQDGRAEFVAGRSGDAATFDGKRVLVAGDRGAFGFFDKFTLAAWIRVPEEGGGTIVSRMADEPQGDGYQLALVDGKLQLNLVKRWLDDSTRVETAKTLAFGTWHHVAATYDGSREAAGIRLYVDGRPQKLTVLLDEINQTFASKEPLRIGGGGGPEMRFRGEIDDVYVANQDLPAEQIQILATSDSIAEILATPAKRRSESQRLKLRACFLAEGAPAGIQAVHRELVSSQRELRAFEESLPTTMVMQELSPPRETHVLIRGQYDQPGELVTADVPAALPPLPAAAPRNRLGLAKWLVDPANPLTARVAVNRQWQTFFGTGLVKTAEDFGVQGERPMHGSLLDWLAADFAAHWDVKRLQRAIVTSGTYRQLSRTSTDGLRRDPENRLLARGPRVRLSAEMVRDQALAASGQLVEQIGGPSVKPYQPAGLWNELTGGEDYKPGKGPDLHRRSLYTFWKRTIPPPTMATFDASSREFCTVGQSRTNTPLQALVLLNEQTFVEAARALAERVMCEEQKAASRLERAFVLVTGRSPAPDESTLLLESLQRHHSHYCANAEETKALVGVDSPVAAERAAYAAVCATILNLDEAVTKQ